MSAPEPPVAILAELTHRCPLQCPYCSNPLELERSNNELGTTEWLRALADAAALGCMQVHFSGGEPMVRRDLEALTAGARRAGLYTNLITSGVLLDEARMAALAEAGLEHVQLSFQDSRAKEADGIACHNSAHALKLQAARLVRDAGLALTANFVVHRQNLDRLEEMIELAVAVGARRAEIANVQFYGWALKNRAALIPTRQQVERASAVVGQARERLRGMLVIDYVVTDYYARWPKACMGGWGRRFLNVSPSGHVLPCHAAQTISGLSFDSVRQRSLSEIWYHSAAFERFRGTGWMREPCRSCERAALDWGGCRCQALALTGDARNADPVCSLSPHHASLAAIADSESRSGNAEFAYRNMRAN